MFHCSIIELFLQKACSGNAFLNSWPDRSFYFWEFLCYQLAAFTSCAPWHTCGECTGTCSCRAQAREWGGVVLPICVLDRAAAVRCTLRVGPRGHLRCQDWVGKGSPVFAPQAGCVHQGRGEERGEKETGRSKKEGARQKPFCTGCLCRSRADDGAYADEYDDHR